MYNYYQIDGGEERWKACPVGLKSKVAHDNNPMFFTVLAVSKMPEELEYDEKLKLRYSGPFYADFDSSDIALVIAKFNLFLDKLLELKFDLDMASLYITGGKGTHIEIPAECFMEKVPKDGVQSLPTIYREMALETVVDTLDLRVYSQGMGRMWRCANKLRPNGKYKVGITLAEARAMTVELYEEACSAPRAPIVPKPPQLCLDLALLYAKAQQKVDEKIKKRGKTKPDPHQKAKAGGPSIGLMAMGQGIRADAGFQQIATQLAIAATTAGTALETFLQDCEGIIANHDGDGTRYNTPAKRSAELQRMYNYVDGNPCYEFSVGAIKVLLTHPAPDLDGISVDRADLIEGIAEAEADAADLSEAPDEYADVAASVTLSKYGIYVSSEEGKRRVCAVSFCATNLLISCDTGYITMYETTVLVNGKDMGRRSLEVDVFATVMGFNKFCATLGHAYSGTELQLRGTFMRFVEQAKKKGGVQYLTKREGLDVVSIPGHENEELRKPFLVWASNRGVLLDPRVSGMGMQMQFKGFPDPQGQFKTDLADAPKLIEWIADDANKAALKRTLTGLLTCQTPEMLSKMIGWYTACFWRMLFHRAYDKFPLLHVVGAAGSGKCLGRGTPVIMADGTLRPVEDVRVGDTLLGPDGGERRVQGVCNGRENLYRVTQNSADAYVVNESHVLSLKLSDKSKGLTLSNGVVVPKTSDVVNVNVKVYAESNKTAKTRLKGWKSNAVEFHREQVELPLDPYWLGAWLGDGRSTGPSLCKPETKMSSWWVADAQARGHTVVNTNPGEGLCPVWSIRGPEGTPGHAGGNYYRAALQTLNLIKNKHIPEMYKYASVADRCKLLAGLIDSDGNVNCGGYKFGTIDYKLAMDVRFIAQSVGLKSTVITSTKFHKVLQREHTMHYVSMCGEVSKLPCLDKPLENRAEDVRVLIQGIEVEPIGEGDYFGFQVDGDHLFMLGDFTVTHNSEMNMAMLSLFYYETDPKSLSPTSSVFSIEQHLAGSSSIPLMLDEYKPHAMPRDLHNRFKSIIRDAYNCKDVTKGGGTRENADYRMLHHVQLSAPMLFIAEAAEDEAAVMERVVLLSVIKPAASVAARRSSLFQIFRANKKHLSILGQYLASQVLNLYDVAKLREEFDEMYELARDKYLLTDKDAGSDMESEEMVAKSHGKERSVFNYTVAKFGFAHFRALVNKCLPGDTGLDGLMEPIENAVYEGMHRLQQSTMPEYLKVLSMMSTMSYAVDPMNNDSLRRGREYDFATLGGSDVMELSARTAYIRYRMYCRASSMVPLFPSHESFIMSLKDSSSLVKHGTGTKIHEPGVFTFRVDELARLGVDPFKP